MGMIIHTVASLAEIKAEADCKAQDENKLTAFRLNVIGGMRIPADLNTESGNT